MSGASRREKIEAMLAETPDDQFLRYALALEMEKAGEHEPSLELLRSLMAETPAHVPSFQMAAQYLAKRGEYQDARAILRGGIDAARNQGETHAASEMSDLLASLGGIGE